MEFSVIIRIRNVFQKLPKTWDSVLTKTYPDFETVAIDGDADETTRGTVKIIRT